MSVKTYKTNTKLSEHFHSNEFKCNCCGISKIDSDLITIIESLMKNVGALHGYVSSGYRCSKHDKDVGGSGSGPHTKGLATDIKFTDKNGNVIPSKTIVLALEDMGHKKGIGYRCGKSVNYTHIDTKNRKWYGDEYYNPYKSCDSYYTYLGITQTKKGYSGTFPKIPLRGYFKNGDKGDQVKYLQKLLNWLNGSKLVCDGIIGNKTITQVSLFQKNNGLKSDGKFGKDSLNKAKTIKK